MGRDEVRVALAVETARPRAEVLILAADMEVLNLAADMEVLNLSADMEVHKEGALSRART